MAQVGPALVWSVGPQYGPVTVPILQESRSPCGLRRVLRALSKAHTGYSSKAWGSLSRGGCGWEEKEPQPEANHAAERGSDGPFVSTVYNFVFVKQNQK